MRRHGEPQKAGELGGDPQAGFKGSTRLKPQAQDSQVTCPRGHCHCRKSSTNLLNSSAKRKCRLCLPSGIRCNLRKKRL